MRVGLSDFVADPTANPLNTPSDLVQISSKAYAETGFSPVPECRVLGTDETGARAGSVNVLTSTAPTIPSYGSRTHSVFVQVKKTQG